ncbi:MAG TPA: asparagine synthase-related protein [Solirubrobacteraceae bacterium]
MSFARCLFAVHVPGGDAAAEVDRRAQRLLAFYAPVGGVRLHLYRGPSLVYGAVDLAADLPGADEELVVWGDRLPIAPLEAGDDALRALDPVVAALAVAPGRARLVVGTATITTLYEAAGAEARAWSSHAVAAAFLADGRAKLDAEAIPELLATGAIGADRSLVAGVRPVEAGTCVEFGPDGPTVRALMPAERRWRLVGERDAAAAVRERLLESVPRRVAGRRVVLGLTAGLDSRVALGALRASGTPFEAVTVGGEGSPDVAGARAIAERLGLEHEVVVPPVPDATRLATDATRDVRWNEGTVGLSRGSETALGADEVFVHGGGGEVGRAYYYAGIARSHGTPGPRQLRRLFALDRQLPDAPPAVAALLRERSAVWLRAAEAAGVDGWRVLDVVAAEQKLRQVNRGYLIPGRAGLIAVFATPALQSALASLTAADKVAAAGHRAALEAWVPELPADPPAGQRRGVPRPVRRVAARLRARRPVARAGERDQVRAWLAGALDAPLVESLLGRDWIAAESARCRGDDPGALFRAQRWIGVLALEEALRELSR